MRGPFLLGGACWSLPLFVVHRDFGSRQCQRRTRAEWTRGFSDFTAGQGRSTALPSACPEHPSSSDGCLFFARVQCCSSHMTRGTSSRFHFQVLPPVIQSWGCESSVQPRSPITPNCEEGYKNKHPNRQFHLKSLHLTRRIVPSRQ